MRSLRRIGFLAALACLALAAPAAAQGTPPSQGSSSQGTSSQDATTPTTTAAVPSRVKSRLNRVDSSLKRASDAIDDGDNAKAIAALKGVSKNLTAADKAAKRRAAADNGPVSFGAVEDGTHGTVSTVAGLFDGVTDTDTVNQLAATLKSALDGRDDLVATISGLTAEQKATYASVLQSMSSDIADEISSIQEALSDDTLKDPEAKDALNAALTQLQASASAVSALISGLGTTTNTAATTPTGTQNAAAGTSQQTGDCPKRDGSGSGQQQQGTTGQQPGSAQGAGSPQGRGGQA